MEKLNKEEITANETRKKTETKKNRKAQQSRYLWNQSEEMPDVYGG